MKNTRQILAAIALLSLIASAGSLYGADDSGAKAKDPYDRSNVPIEVQPTDPKAAKIVLIAGDSGSTHPSGDHEHFAGCALLMRMLQQTPGVAPVMAKDGWPTNPQTLKDARTIVFYMDGGGKQTTIAHADEIQKLMDAGVGIVHIHQCIDYPTDAGKQAMRWLGGVFEPKTGARGHWDESFTTFVDHEITRGVAPFKLNDGWILKLSFVPGMKGITPLLRTTQLSPKPKPDEKITGTNNIVCWAFERADGGRAFVLTGGHGHKNWGLEGLRKLAVNGILWSAKVEIPKDGAPVKLDPADLMTNLENKPMKKPAKAVSKAGGEGAPVKPDEELMQGFWKIVSQKIDGVEQPDVPARAIAEVAGDHMFEFKRGERSRPILFKLGMEGPLRTIDATFESDEMKGNIIHGIYDLKGDDLTFCLSKIMAPPPNEGARPRSFSDPATVITTAHRVAKPVEEK